MDDSYPVFDPGTYTTHVFKSREIGGIATPYVVAQQHGSTGTSFSINLPALNTLGTLLLTIPANPNRAFAFVENQSAGDLTLVGDVGDGTQVWYRKLTGVGANLQGADWGRSDFFGRVRVYGTAGVQVSAGEF